MKAKLIVAGVVAAGCGIAGAAWWLSDTTGQEMDRLWATGLFAPGKSIGEVGAGTGRMAIEIARRVGPGGHVLATEMEDEKRKAIAERALAAGLTNVTVLEAAEAGSNLPGSCCDVILMRRVYHHLADPAGFNRTLLRALRPGGTLVVIDFEPKWWLTMFVPVPRGEHGLAASRLAGDLRAAGFDRVETDPVWPGGFRVTAVRPGVILWR